MAAASRRRGCGLNHEEWFSSSALRRIPVDGDMGWRAGGVVIAARHGVRYPTCAEFRGKRSSISREGDH